MTLAQVAWSLIGLDVLLLLIWVYSLVFPSGGTDAAGRGLGQVYTIGLALYLLLPIGLMLFRNRLGMIIAILLAGPPLLLALYGVVRWIKNR